MDIFDMFTPIERIERIERIEWIERIEVDVSCCSLTVYFRIWYCIALYLEYISRLTCQVDAVINVSMLCETR